MIRLKECIRQALIVVCVISFPQSITTPLKAANQKNESNVSVTFAVTVPTFTPPEDTIFLAGNMNEWDPGSGEGSSENDLPMTQISEFDWEIVLSLSQDSTYEYKYTRGSWLSVEKDENGNEIDNRTIHVGEINTSTIDTVATWRDSDVPTTPQNVSPIVTIYNNSPQTSIAITWASEANGNNILYYGENNINENQIMVTEYREMITAGDSLIHIARLSGLIPNTEYYYKVETQGVYESDTLSFTTALADSLFSFIVFGDNQPEVNSTILNRVIQENPRFVLHTGDMLLNGNRLDLWFDFFSDHKNLVCSIPMMPIYGNHEEDASYLTQFFTLPENGSPDSHGHWYSFDYNNIHVIALDNYRDYTSGSDQQNWLLNDLQSIGEGVDHIIVFFHEPPYCSGKYGSNLEVRQNLVPIFEDYGVDLVFSGHNHLYERSIVNGITYIVTAGAGATLYQSYPGSNPYSVYVESVFHYCNVYVNGKVLGIEMIREDGSIGDVHYSLQVDGKYNDWESSGVIPIEDTDGLQSDPELKLERFYITQDIDYFYFGFDVPAKTKTVTYGMYIDVDNIGGSGGTTDCFGNAISAISQHLPEIEIYACHENNDTWSSSSPEFYNWDQLNSEWLMASGGMGNLPTGGIFAVDTVNRFFEMAIPKDAPGFSGADSFFIELFTVGETQGAGASESIPSDSSVQFTLENISTNVTVLTAFYGYNVSEPIPMDTNTIHIDGNPSDWISMGIDPIAVDTDNAQLDAEYQLDSLLVFMDSADVYFGFVTPCRNIGLHYGIYIDTDNVMNSGGTIDKWRCDVTAVPEHRPEISIYAYHKDTGGWSASSPKYYTWNGSDWVSHTGGFGSLPTGGEFAHNPDKDFVEIKVPRSSPGFETVSNFYISLFNFGSAKKVCETVPSDPAVQFNGENISVPIQLSSFVYFQAQNVATDQEDLSGIYKSFKLIKNYPNPFNSSTTFEYELDIVSVVEIKIFDLLGREIYSKRIGNQNPGLYKFTLNGKDNNGLDLQSGIYFALLKRKGDIKIQKITLLK